MDSNDRPAAVPADLPAVLRALVVRDHVHLGGLTHELRQQVLALLWTGLPRAPCDERAVNEALRDLLAGPGAFLAVDHVELRRWLVDLGFLVRDGFGRVYERVAGGALPAVAREVAAPLEAVDVAAACRAARAHHAEQRARRRAAWAAPPTQAVTER